MNSLPELIPDEKYLLSLEAEELASLVLIMAKKQMQNAMLHQGNFPILFSDPIKAVTNIILDRLKSKSRLRRLGTGWKYRD